MEYLHVVYQGIKVFYLPHLEGGGIKFGQDYLRLVRDQFGTVGRVYEWCSGPAFIGFSLLAHKLCNSLCLADINPDAVEACKKTIADNRLSDRVSVYLSDCLDELPIHEKFDLVVGNPPHSPTDKEIPSYGPKLVYQDIGWDNHRRFYKGIKAHLNAGANVIIQENGVVSRPEDFTEMVSEGGMALKDVFPVPNTNQKYYYWTVPVR